MENFTAGSYSYLLEYRKIVCIVIRIFSDISKRRRNKFQAVGLICTKCTSQTFRACHRTLQNTIMMVRPIVYAEITLHKPEELDITLQCRGSFLENINAINLHI
jgi:hypothetical protein